MKTFFVSVPLQSFAECFTSFCVFCHSSSLYNHEVSHFSSDRSGSNSCSETTRSDQNGAILIMLYTKEWEVAREGYM